jgi:hypothetical protein
MLKEKVYYSSLKSNAEESKAHWELIKRCFLQKEGAGIF